MSKTFADIAKTIRKRFEGRENDPAAMRTMEAQMTKLMEANEMAKSEKEETENAMMDEARKWGGAIKYAKGGRLVIDKAHKNDMIDAAKARGMGVMSYAKELGRVAEMRCGGKIYEDGGTLTEKYFRNGGTTDPPWEPLTSTEDVYSTALSNFGEERANYLRDNNRLQQFVNRTDLTPELFTLEASSDHPLIRNNEQLIAESAKADTRDPLRTGPGADPYIPPTVNTPSSEAVLPPAPGTTPQQNAATSIPSTPRGPKRPSTAEEINAMRAKYTTDDLPTAKPGINDHLTGANVDPAGKVYSSKSAASAAQKKYDLPAMPEYTTKSGTSGKVADSGLGSYKNAGAGSNAIDPKWGAIASAAPYLADLVTASTVDKTKLDRVDLEELDLTKQRKLTRRDSAIGRLMARKHARRATSSGQALSTLAAQNAALTDAQIKSDLQSYLQEETAGVQARNQEELTNQQISTQEKIINEQNKGIADSNKSQALHGISGAAQGYIKDTNLTAENLRYNDTAIEIMNQMSPNYQWGTDPETEAWVLQFVQKQQG